MLAKLLPKFLSKFIVALICTFIMAFWQSVMVSFTYFDMYLIFTAFIYIVLGIPVSWMIDRSLGKADFNQTGKTLIGMFLYSIAGAIFIVWGLCILFWDIRALAVFASPEILLLGAVSALLFYLVQLLVSLIQRIMKRIFHSTSMEPPGDGTGRTA